MTYWPHILSYDVSSPHLPFWLCCSTCPHSQFRLFYQVYIWNTWNHVHLCDWYSCVRSTFVIRIKCFISNNPVFIFPPTAPAGAKDEGYVPASIKATIPTIPGEGLVKPCIISMLLFHQLEQSDIKPGFASYLGVYVKRVMEKRWQFLMLEWNVYINRDEFLSRLR